MTALASALSLGGFVLVSSQANATTRDVYPGQSIASALSSSQPGDVVVVHNGTYPRQRLTNRPSGTVTVRGESRDGVVLQGLNLSGGAANLVFTNLTVTTAGTSDSESAVKIYGGANHVTLDSVTVSPQTRSGIEIHNYGGAPHDVAVSNSVVTGAGSTTAGSRNVWVGDLNGGPDSTWPYNISITGNDLGYAASDDVHVSGGTNVTIEGNFIHDPQQTSDHNDGVQSVASTNLRIVRNRFSAAGTWSCSTVDCVPPDQAIILGHAVPAAQYKRVTNTYVADNLVSYWRGKGILVNGTDGTRIVNNTSTHNGPPGTTVAASMTISEGGDGYRNTDLKLWNNVFDRLATATLAVPPAYLDHNCIREGGSGAANYAGDPDFADTTSFALADASPCIDAGLDELSWETPVVDLVGNPRDAHPDNGARERVASGTPTAGSSTATTSTTVAPSTTTTTIKSPKKPSPRRLTKR